MPRLRHIKPASVLIALCAAFALSLGLASPALAAESSAKEKDAPNTVSIVAVGDDLIHTSVYKACKTSKGYNFDRLFRHVKDDVKAADIAAINQETILVDRRYSGYPTFGSPKKLADSIAKAGFDVVTGATNHSMDRGAGAITGTLAYWKKKHPEVTVLGLHKSAKDASRIRVVKKNGIKIAMLNYTYGLNGIPLPSGRHYLVDLLTSSRKARIAKDIKRAKKKADAVIVFTHWGTEYRHSPDSSQKYWAKFFADRGVDIVVGAHPHVVEPMRWVKGKSGKKMLCYYSLGNFVSGQTSRAKLLGGMAKFTLAKTKKGVKVKKNKMVPLVTHIGHGRSSFTTYKLADYTNALARKHNYYTSSFTPAKLKSLFRRVSK